MISNLVKVFHKAYFVYSAEISMEIHTSYFLNRLSMYLVYEKKLGS